MGVVACRRVRAAGARGVLRCCGAFDSYLRPYMRGVSLSSLRCSAQVARSWLSCRSWDLARGQSRFFVPDKFSSNKFGVKHYAESIIYRGRLERNRDSLHAIWYIVSLNVSVLFEQIINAKRRSPQVRRRLKSAEDVSRTETRYVRCVKPNSDVASCLMLHPSALN